MVTSRVGAYHKDAYFQHVSMVLFTSILVYVHVFLCLTIYIFGISVRCYSNVHPTETPHNKETSIYKKACWMS